VYVFEIIKLFFGSDYFAETVRVIISESDSVRVSDRPRREEEEEEEEGEKT